MVAPGSNSSGIILENVARRDRAEQPPAISPKHTTPKKAVSKTVVARADPENESVEDVDEDDGP